MRFLTLLFVFVPALTFAQVPLHVFTSVDPSGFVDEESKLRMKTVIELKNDLIRSKLVKLTTIEEATIVIEIKGTSEKEVLNTLALLANSMTSPNKNHRQDETQIITLRHAILTVGTYTTELTSQMRKERTQFKKIIEEWVKDNSKQLKLK